MDDMKISFKVEITGCLVNKVRCPHAIQDFPHSFCSKSEWRGYVTFRENEGKLTKTCPMIKKKLEKEADRMDAYLFKLESETTDPN